MLHIFKKTNLIPEAPKANDGNEKFFATNMVGCYQVFGLQSPSPDSVVLFLQSTSNPNLG